MSDMHISFAIFHAAIKKVTWITLIGAENSVFGLNMADFEMMCDAQVARSRGASL